MTMHRRQLIGAVVAGGGGSLLDPSAAESTQPASTPPSGIIDTNVSLFQWPFRRLPLDDTGRLVQKLRSLGVTEAWAGSFEGILHRDIAGVNRRLADACAQYPELLPIATINPALPDWQEDFRRCVADKMPGIRLHPGYHGYTLSDPRLVQLLKLAASKRRLVQIVAIMEDARTEHPMLRAGELDLAVLPEQLRKAPGAMVQILNGRPQGVLLDQLAESPHIYFDTARVEGTDGIPKLLEKVSGPRLMFGTHAPFLIPEAALLRTAESSLDDRQWQSLMGGNARRIRRATN